MLKGIMFCVFCPLKAYNLLKTYEVTIRLWKEKYESKVSEYCAMQEKALYWQERALHKKHTVNPENKEII